MAVLARGRLVCIHARLSTFAPGQVDSNGDRLYSFLTAFVLGGTRQKEEHMNQAHDLEQLAFEALADHASAVGEACIREARAPTKEEQTRFYELETAVDDAMQAAHEARVKAITGPTTRDIARQMLADAKLKAEQYRRTLEGRGY